MQLRNSRFTCYDPRGKDRNPNVDVRKGDGMRGFVRNGALRNVGAWEGGAPRMGLVAVG